MIVIDNIVYVTKKHFKGNTRKWFDGEVLEKLTIRPLVGKELSDTYINVNSYKKHETFDENFSKSIANPKQLWETLRSIVMIMTAMILYINPAEHNS